MATVKAILKPEERKTDRTHLVMLRLYANGSMAYLSTGVYVPKSNFNPNGGLDKCDWIKKHTQRDQFNQAIERLVKEANALSLEHRTATAKELKERLQGKEERPDFIAFYKSELDRIQQEANDRTYRKYLYIYGRLSEYTHSLPFEKLNVEWVKRYEQHVLKTNNRNTTSKHLAFVKTITRRAVAEGLIPYADNPFLNYKLKGERPQKDRLTREELQAVMDLDLPEGKRLSQSRDAFLLQFFMAGMRIGDLLQMRWEMVEGDRLEYRSQKTDAALSVRIVPAALALMGERRKKGFVLPFLKEGLTPEMQQKRVESMTALINKNLREVATLAGIEKRITTHVARHSFASLAWANSRDIKAVSQALGHTSVRMTETYLRELTGTEQDDLLHSAFRDF